jgi:diadenosine tetraphosphate (Ap4A) HIT family hydrolase
MSDGCEICSIIPSLTPESRYFVAELDSGYAVLGWNQMYEGYTLFLAKRCVPELHMLPADERATFLREMARVAEAVFRAFAPNKLNYELLGNSTSHLHWHLFPRHVDDPLPRWPVWSSPEFLAAPRRTEIAPERLRDMRERLQAALREVP